MRTIAMITSVGACAVAVLATTACGSTPSQEPAPTTVTVTAEQEQTGLPPAPPPEEVPAEAQAAAQWPMPNLVGQVLQDAQDQIQALTGGAVFFSDSHDLSGEDRNQVLDANWQVCTQNITAGTAIDAASLIDLGVVKLDESCP